MIARIALLAVCTVALCAGVATPAWAVKEYQLPSHITIETVALPGPNDPDRCVAWAFAEFPVIPRAKGYELTVADTRNGTRQTESGPPFPDDTWDDYPAQYKVHKGFHWFALSGYSVGSGCGDAILGLDGAYKIVRARVSLERAFESRVEERSIEPNEKVEPCSKLPPRLGKAGEPLMITRLSNRTGVYVASNRLGRFALVNNAMLGEAVTIATDSRSAVAVVPLSGGDGIIIGPGVKMRIEPGKRPELIRRDPGASIKDVEWGRTPINGVFRTGHGFGCRG